VTQLRGTRGRASTRGVDARWFGDQAVPSPPKDAVGASPLIDLARCLPYIKSTLTAVVVASAAFASVSAIRNCSNAKSLVVRPSDVACDAWEVVACGTGWAQGCESNPVLESLR
jgi:hypothetical protein